MSRKIPAQHKGGQRKDKDPRAIEKNSNNSEGIKSLEDYSYPQLTN